VIPERESPLCIQMDDGKSTRCFLDQPPATGWAIGLTDVVSNQQNGESDSQIVEKV
jgi:hypothetical protein